MLPTHLLDRHGQFRKQSSYCSNTLPAQCQAIDSERRRDPGKDYQINAKGNMRPLQFFKVYVLISVVVYLRLCVCVFFLCMCVYLHDTDTRQRWVRPYRQTPCFLAVLCVAWRRHCSVRLDKRALHQQQQQGPAVTATLQVPGMDTGNTMNP